MEFVKAELHLLLITALSVVLLVVCLFVCLALLMGALYGILLLSDGRRRKRAEREGYWVERLGSGDSDEHGRIYLIVYHEGQNIMAFGGRSNHRGQEVIVREDQLLPDWLKGRREMVAQRIQRDFKGIQIVTKIEPGAER